jgi:hypothetical protein
MKTRAEHLCQARVEPDREPSRLPCNYRAMQVVISFHRLRAKTWQHDGRLQVPPLRSPRYSRKSPEDNGGNPEFNHFTNSDFQKAL